MFKPERSEKMVFNSICYILLKPNILLINVLYFFGEAFKTCSFASDLCPNAEGGIEFEALADANHG